MTWRGWASTVMYGPRYEPDQLPRHRAAGRSGRQTTRIGYTGRATSRTDYLLDLLASGPTTLIHNESPWSLQLERASRLRPWGKVSADQSLHTAGRRNLIGPAAAVGSGPGRSKGSGSDQNQSRMETVEGGGHGEPHQDELGLRAAPGRAGTV